MNLTDFQNITQQVGALEVALCNYVCVTEDINLPSLFYAHCCGADAKQLMANACKEIATKDATEAIRKAKEDLQALGMTVTESDIKTRLEAIQGQRRAYRDMHRLLTAETSPAVN